MPPPRSALRREKKDVRGKMAGNRAIQIVTAHAKKGATPKKTHARTTRTFVFGQHASQPAGQPGKEARWHTNCSSIAFQK